MTVLTPRASRAETTQIVMPMHVNGAGGVMFGGIVMSWIDVCAGVSAIRHAAGPVVTASIDRLDFITPIRLGEIVILQSQVNFTATTSMEVGCRVETEDLRTRERRYTTKAYLTFVAVDGHGRPRPIQPIVPESDEDRRRFADAARRREDHLRSRLVRK
jgi:acyl-CoA hydrolase